MQALSKSPKEKEKYISQKKKNKTKQKTAKANKAPITLRHLFHRGKLTTTKISDTTKQTLNSQQLTHDEGVL